MAFPSFSLDEIRSLAGDARVRGSCAGPFTGIAALLAAGPSDLSFLGNTKYRDQVGRSRAGVLLLPTGFPGEPPAGQAWVEVANPSLALASICARVESRLRPRPPAGIAPSAVIAPTATIDSSASVGPLCVVEAGAVVGAECWLEAGSYVGARARLGARCHLHAGSRVGFDCNLGEGVILHMGVVVGSDGFGYEFHEGRHQKVPQIGSVRIEDDVEIGANSTIDRARFGETVVGAGTKIDNLVQIAHNVVIGRHCIICSQAGISGSTTLEDFVLLAGQAGLAGHIRIGAGSKIAGQCGVNVDLEPKSYVTGTPHLPYMLDRRINVLRRRLPDLFREVGEIRRHLGLQEKAGSH
ncbi:MAG: UDP-3-O-(3-hydroxymyristoyl)glucosamine N-acyltransferase [Puniceicoccaceae bacterium]|nr:MAG: UDP-3-O-(3-hydroxymyristoyl)glucosamine N-acyltransferase [Puniceicoccaceae bacterium]